MTLHPSDEDDGAIHPDTRTSLLLPSLALAGCVCAYISRDTLNARLSPKQNLNHLPAAPLISIVWLIQGESSLIQVGDQVVELPSARVVLRGPRTQPTVWKSRGPVLGFALAFFPDAFHALTNLEISSLVNRVEDLDGLLDQDWQQMSNAVLCAADDAARIRVIETFLSPRWAKARPHLSNKSSLFHDWVEAVAMRAATSTLGKSIRQLERRIKGESGLSMRELRGMARMESTFLHKRELSSVGQPSFADVAHDMGFSDQSHLSREVKRFSGLSLTELQKAIETQESFWPYRSWR